MTGLWKVAECGDPRPCALHGTLAPGQSAPGTVTVGFENTYSDGHESEHVLELPAPDGDLAEWWQDVVFPHTGDGHGADSEGSCLTATIIRADNAELVGLSEEWTD